MRISSNALIQIARGTTLRAGSLEVAVPSYLLPATSYLLPATSYALQGERRFSYRHTHIKGRAILHCGHHRHGADDLASGERFTHPNPDPDLNPNPDPDPNPNPNPNPDPNPNPNPNPNLNLNPDPNPRASPSSRRALQPDHVVQELLLPPHTGLPLPLPAAAVRQVG